MPISRSTGLLGNPPVFTLLVTSCSTNQSRQLVGRWAISPGGKGNYYGDILLFCRCSYLEWLTRLNFLAILTQSRAWTLCQGWSLNGSAHPVVKLTTLRAVKKKKSDKMLHHCRFWWCYFQIASPVHGGPVIPYNCFDFVCLPKGFNLYGNYCLSPPQKISLTHWNLSGHNVWWKMYAWFEILLHENWVIIYSPLFLIHKTSLEVHSKKSFQHSPKQLKKLGPLDP